MVALTRGGPAPRIRPLLCAPRPPIVHAEAATPSLMLM